MFRVVAKERVREGGCWRVIILGGWDNLVVGGGRVGEDIFDGLVL